ncbi:MAG: pyruvate kinase, partial [Planctomyces sp.]
MTLATNPAQPTAAVPTLVKIVATIGPACDTPEMVARLISAGVGVFRLNFSHGSFDQHEGRLRVIRSVASSMGLPVAVLGDLPGPKIRTGRVDDLDGSGGLRLGTGQEVLIEASNVPARIDRGIPMLGCTYGGIVRDALPGQRVLINDGVIRMLVVASEVHDGAAVLRCAVTTGGVVTSSKGINLPDTDLKIPAITQRDLECVQWAVGQGIDFLALSFVRTPDEVRELKRILAGMCAVEFGTDQTGEGSMIPVIAKIEKPQAVANMDAIVKQADGIMVARGDLGVEMDIALVPVVQKQLVAAADNWGKPCIVATQMLESMISSPGPTRAEVTDVANAVFDGADAVMLSGETAVGKFPLVTVETMRRVIDTAEKRITELRHDPSPPRRVIASGYRTAALAHAAWYLARDMHAKAVVVWSQTGGGARYLSQTNFTVPIIAYSS